MQSKILATKREQLAFRSPDTSSSYRGQWGDRGEGVVGIGEVLCIRGLKQFKSVQFKGQL